MIALIEVVRIAATLLTILIFLRVILSWVNPSADNRLVAMIYRTTEPMLRPIRNMLPSIGGIDFSPVIVLIAIQIVEGLLVRVLAGMAAPTY